MGFIALLNFNLSRNKVASDDLFKKLMFKSWIDPIIFSECYMFPNSDVIQINEFRYYIK